MREILTVGLLVCAMVAARAALAQDAALVAAGQEVYEATCMPCHGVGLTPIQGVFDLKTLRANERRRFNRSVMDGVDPDMPPWAGIVTEEQLDQLWAFIQANR